MTRRNFLSYLISTGTGSPLPPADRTGISPRMAGHIENFQRSEAILAALSDEEPPAAWDAAGAAELAALKALLDEPPANLAEFSVKFEALVEATETDTEFHILRVLTSDVRRLMEAGR